MHEEIARQREDFRREISTQGEEFRREVGELKVRVTDIERNDDRIDGALRLVKGLGIPVGLLVLKEIGTAILPLVLKAAQGGV